MAEWVPVRKPSVSRGPMPVWVPGVLLHLFLGLHQLHTHDLVDDETFSLAATQHLADTLQRTHGTMALYYLVLWPWARMSHAAAWVRLPSLIFSCIAVVLIGALVGRQAGTSAGRLASIFAALSVPVIQQSVTARSYSMWLVAAALAWYLLDRCLEDEHGRWLHLAFALTVMAMPLIHGMAIVGVAGLGLVILWARPSARQRMMLLIPCVAAAAITGMLYQSGQRGIGVGAADTPIDLATARLFLRGVVFPGVRVSLVLLVIASIGGWRLARNRGATPLDRYRNVGLLVWGPLTALGTFVLLCSVPQSVIARYAFPSALAVAGLLAVAVAPPSADSTTGRPRAVGLSWVSRLATASIIAVMALGLTELPAPNHEWIATFEIVQSNREPGDRIIFVPAEARLGYEAVATATPGTLDLAGPGKPLGTFDRFGSADDSPRIQEGIDDAPRVWIIVRRGDASERFAAELLASEPIAHQYERPRVWRPGPHLVVWLLARHGGGAG